ncbi:hypothetical protein FKM82_010055 [Ascaphus truei]
MASSLKIFPTCAGFSIHNTAINRSDIHKHTHFRHTCQNIINIMVPSTPDIKQEPKVKRMFLGYILYCK